MSPAPIVLNFGFGSQTTVLNFGFGSHTTVFMVEADFCAVTMVEHNLSSSNISTCYRKLAKFESALAKSTLT